MRKMWKTAVAAMVLTCAGGAVLAADIALLIANTRYDQRSRVRDADREIGPLIRAYQRNGFDLTHVQNLSASEMADALRSFEEASRDADRVVIHFIGHVSQSRMNTRIVPRGMGQGSLVGAHYAAASLDLLYELVAHRPGRSAVLISTPYARHEDMIRSGPAIPQGVLVMAGSPKGFTRAIRDDFLNASNSPAALKARNEFTVAGFVTDTGFAPATTLDEPRISDASETPARRAIVEMRAWRSAAQTGTKEALEQYLATYPNGMFSQEAEARIAALAPPVPPEQRIEDALNLTRAERRDIQRNLTLLGFDTRGVDGIFGRGSRTAISAWQRAERFRQSGYLDTAQIRLLSRMAADRQAQLDREAEAAKEAEAASDIDYWRATGESGQEDDLRAYLARFPQGLFANQAQRLLDQLDADKPLGTAADAGEEAALNLNRQTMRLVEQRLRALGYDPGPIDGKFDAKTRAAIADFQQRSSLKSTGYLNGDTVAILVVSVFR